MHRAAGDLAAGVSLHHQLAAISSATGCEGRALMRTETTTEGGEGGGVHAVPKGLVGWLITMNTMGLWLINKLTKYLVIVII